jgi:predicted ester cyclase
MSAEDNKVLVRRLVEEAAAGRNLDVLDQIAAGEFVEIARRWVSPFQSAFPDFEMRIVDLIAEGEKVVARFQCSGTRRGEWLGVRATGRRFEDVHEIYVFSVQDGRLVSALGVEDNPHGFGSLASRSRRRDGQSSPGADRRGAGRSRYPPL